MASLRFTWLIQAALPTTEVAGRPNRINYSKRDDESRKFGTHCAR